MNLRQLRVLCEIVDQGLNMSAAAKALHTSQPGISKQMKLLEDELAVPIFIRCSNRIEAITEEGMEVVAIARRMLSDAQSIARMKRRQGAGSHETITVAATYVHGRHLVQPAIESYSRQHPHTRFRVLHAATHDIFQALGKGEVDLGICISHAQPPDSIQQLPLGDMKLCLITPPRHPLLRRKPASLRDLAAHPFIGLEACVTGVQTMLEAFRAQEADLDTVLSAPDPDAVKAYVALGMGVAILPAMTLDPARDRGVRIVEVNHLFPPLTSCLVLDRRFQIRPEVDRFIQALRQDWRGDAQPPRSHPPVCEPAQRPADYARA